MKKLQLSLLLALFISISETKAQQNEEFLNTYVNTFNEYLYPWGNVFLNEDASRYNPYNQFAALYPYDLSPCLPLSESRINLVNYQFPYPANNYPDLYCSGYELGEGINNSGSMRVTIKGINDNAGGIPNDGSDTRSRVELMYHPKHYNETGYTANVLNETYYYRWNFFVPNDNTFVDSTPDNSFHIISQFHQPTWKETFDSETGIRTSDQFIKVNLRDGELPPLFITYGHELNIKDNKRDIIFVYGYRNENIDSGTNLDRSSNFSLTDAINKGEWNTIVLEIKWSPNDHDGYMKAWVNDQVVYGNPDEINTEEGNPNYQTTTPEVIKGANMLLTKEGFPLSNVMQMGHYRDNLDTEATIYFDDLIITQNRDFALNGFKTSLKPEYCGNILSNTTIEAIPLPKTSKYKFKFEEIGNESNSLEVERGSNSYNILDNENYFQPAKTYKVKVYPKVEGENTYREYNIDTDCLIVIPFKTKLTEEYCNKLLDLEDLIIKCKPVNNATNYSFRFTPENGQQIWADRSSPEVDLRYDDRFKTHTEYHVEVKAQGSDFSFNYDDICNIKIPRFTKLKDCITKYSINDEISCYNLPGTTLYKFRFKDGVSGQEVQLNSTTPTLQIPDVPYFRKGGYFLVDIRDINHGYGEACNIYIYPSAITLRNSSENKNTLDINNYPVLFPNPFSQEINLADFNSDLIIQIYNFNGKLIFDKKVIKGTEKLNLEYLTKGIYFFIINTKDNRIFNKLIKE